MPVQVLDEGRRTNVPDPHLRDYTPSSKLWAYRPDQHRGDRLFVTDGGQLAFRISDQRDTVLRSIGEVSMRVRSSNVINTAALNWGRPGVCQQLFDQPIDVVDLSRDRLSILT